MTRLLSLDPGLPDCGASLFENGVLTRSIWAHVEYPFVSCPICSPRQCKHQHGHARAQTLLCDAVEEGLGLGQHDGLDVAVSEWPQIFHHAGKVGAVTVQQYLDLAAVAGTLLDRAEVRGAAQYRFTPQQWKGNLDKPSHQRRGLALLSPEERAILPKMPKAGRYLSDPLDSALLGMWFLHAMGGRVAKWYGKPQDFEGLLEENELPRRRGKST